MTPIVKWRMIVAALFAAYLSGMILLFVWTQRADGAESSRCRPPDPYARPIIDLSAGELRTLAKLVWAEARGESDPYCSMQAVASVVVNRVRTNPRYFGASVTQVINRPYAFSVFGKRDPNRAKMGRVDESDASYVTALLASIAAVSGADPTGRATHFHAAGARPAWADDLLVTTRIGHHVFYR